MNNPFKFSHSPDLRLALNNQIESTMESKAGGKLEESVNYSPRDSKHNFFTEVSFADETSFPCHRSSSLSPKSSKAATP